MAVRKTKQKMSKTYLLELQGKDFLGELSTEEVVVARKHGLLKYNSWAKERREKLQKLDENS